MEMMFNILYGAWLGTAIAIIQYDVINPILENDYDFYNAMDQIQPIQFKEGEMLDDNI
jgi:hypothetical protein